MKKEKSLSKAKSNLIFIIIGLQIIYSAYKFIITASIVTFSFELLFNPLIILNITIYGIVIYISISFIRLKPIGWYGCTSLYTFNFLKGILIIISIITVSTFKNTIFQNLKLPSLTLNSNIFLELLIFTISTVMLWFMYNSDVIDGIEFENKSKKKIIVKSVIFSILILIIICLLLFILVK